MQTTQLSPDLCPLCTSSSYNAALRTTTTSPMHIFLNPRVTRGRRHPQSLSLPGPSRLSSSSSSSCTTSSPAVTDISAFCSMLLSSAFLGSAKSIGRSLALFRILHTLSQPLRPFPAPSLAPHNVALTTYLGSHPASTKISTHALPPSRFHSAMPSSLHLRTA